MFRSSVRTESGKECIVINGRLTDDHIDNACLRWGLKLSMNGGRFGKG